MVIMVTDLPITETAGEPELLGAPPEHVKEALLNDAYGPIRPQIIHCEPCGVKFTINGRRDVLFCPYCGKEAARIG
jgi:hypothetical protein